MNNTKTRTHLTILTVLVVIAATVFAGGWAMLSNTSERYYKIINLAGQQRMLTQRIAYFVSMGNLTPLETERLQQALDLIKVRHKEFTSGESALGIPKPQKGDDFYTLYFGPANVNKGIVHLTEAVQNYIDSKGTERPFSVHSSIPEQLLRKTNLAVDLYINHGSESLKTLRSWFMLIMLIITLAILVEISWLFRLLKLSPGDEDSSEETSAQLSNRKNHGIPSEKVAPSPAETAFNALTSTQSTKYQSEQPHPLECKSALILGSESLAVENELQDILGFECLHCSDIEKVADQLRAREQSHRPIDLIICKDAEMLEGINVLVSDTILQHDYCCIGHPTSITDMTKIFETFCGEHKHHNVTFPDKHVLLVDDNDINLMVLEGMVSKCHVQCVLAHNGLQAVEKAKQQSFDLILMDLQMPTMNGYEATENILTDSKNQNTPVIAITANHDYQGRIKCLELGMVGCEAKPVHHTTIEHILYKYLK